jgi:hypothetical protein
MDWNSIVNSDIVGAVQNAAMLYAQNRRSGNPPPIDPEDAAGGIATQGRAGQGRAVAQDQPDAVEGNERPRVGSYRELRKV